MLGCYRRGEVADEKVFTSAIIAVLCRYPENVVKVVTNPTRGLPATLKWLPSIAEVRDACDREMEPILRERQRQASRLEQQRERLAPPEVTAEGRERAVARWKAVRDGMTGESDEQRQREKDEAAERLAKLATGHRPPLVASAALRSKLGEAAA